MMNNWRGKLPTNAQKEAIENMCTALKISTDIPESRGLASDRIKKLQSMIEKNISICGYAYPYPNSYDNGLDDEYD